MVFVVIDGFISIILLLYSSIIYPRNIVCKQILEGMFMLMAGHHSHSLEF